MTELTREQKDSLIEIVQKNINSFLELYWERQMFSDFSQENELPCDIESAIEYANDHIVIKAEDIDRSASTVLEWTVNEQNEVKEMIFDRAKDIDTGESIYPENMMLNINENPYDEPLDRECHEFDLGMYTAYKNIINKLQ